MRNSLVIILALFLCSCAVSRQSLTTQEIKQRAESDLQEIHADQDPVGDAPITLNDAMARAIKYNLDHRLKMMEIILAQKQLDVSRYDLLPDLTVSAGYNSRSNDLASYSVSMADGSESLTSSTSQEKDNFTNELKIVWNVLDFGVSYLRTKQQIDQSYIIRERKRKVVQNIIQDVRYAYWRAVCAERLVNEMVDLLDKSKSALKRSRQMTEAGIKSPKESLEYQRALLENIRMLWSLIQKLSPAKTELAALMNLPPGTKYQLAEPQWNNPEVPGFASPVARLEQLALISRPELQEEDYKSRISSLEIRKTMLQMLPGLEFQLGYNYDSNKFLYNKDWWNAGAFISQKIFNLVSGPARIDAAESQHEFDKMRRQALSMAVMLQTRLAHQHYHLVKRQYLVNRNLDEINTRLNQHIIMEIKAGKTDELTAIQSATNTMVARLRHYLAYAEMQNAVGRLFNSLGLDPLPPETIGGNLTLLAESLEQSFTRWDNLVNSLDTKSDKNNDNDSDIKTIIAAFDKGISWPGATNRRTAAAYNYDWLESATNPPAKHLPSRRIIAENTEPISEEDLSLPEPPPSQARAPKIKMKKIASYDHHILQPVDESVYGPKKITMINGGGLYLPAYYRRHAYERSGGLAIRLSTPKK
jgi:outer membrane protein TolC